VPSGEATYTNFIVFGLTQLGPEPLIYRIPGEHTNHVMLLDAYVQNNIDIFIYVFFLHIHYNICNCYYI